MQSALLCLLVLFLVVHEARAATSTEIPFCMIGDWGGISKPPYTTDVQLAVAKAMGVVCGQIGAKFVVSTGDNFYSRGVTAATDPRFQSTFENVYTSPALQIPWLMVAGNHDYYGNDVQAEIEYSKYSSRWTFPSLNWDRVFTLPGTTEPLMHVVFLDTWDLTTASKDKGGPPLDPAKGKAAVAFLKSRFSNSTAIWRVVVTHYPIYDAGHHGPVNKDLLKDLLPALIESNVDAYFSGHDHNLQHLYKPQDSGIHFFVSGAGKKPDSRDRGREDDPDMVKFMFPLPHQGDDMGGFNTVQVTPKQITVSFYRQDTKLLYQYNVEKATSIDGRIGISGNDVQPTESGSDKAGSLPVVMIIVGVMAFVLLSVVGFYMIRKKLAQRQTDLNEATKLVQTI